MKSFHFSLGNSTIGPIGFCASVKANSEEEAVELLKRVLPMEARIDPVGDEDEDNARIEYIEVYFNEESITEKDIDDIDEGQEEAEEAP